MKKMTTGVWAVKGTATFKKTLQLRGLLEGANFDMTMEPGNQPDVPMREAEAQSKARQRAVLARVDLAAARYQLVLASEPASFAMQIDLRAAVPWSEWPMPPDTSKVRVALEHQGQSLVLQPGRVGERGWRFDFRKHLAAESQPFDVVAARQVGWDELPWGEQQKRT